VAPRYQQITLDVAEQKNNFAQILSPNADDEGVWIHQDAWFYLADFDKDFSKTYSLKKEGNGMYVFVISGTITVDGQELETRDGLGITDFDTLEIKATSDAKFLLMEIPMEQ
jgi:redox-sensitive bicupin YhaK (pirin superfamily)